jgi:hypothetical protein
MLLAVARKNPAVRRMRFVGCESRIDRALRIRQCALHLLARFPRMEIPRHDRANLPSDVDELLPRLWFTESRELSFEGVEPLDGLRIFARAIKQGGERLVLALARWLVWHRKEVSAAAAAWISEAWAANTAFALSECGSTYTPSRKIPAPADFSARQMRMRRVLLVPGRFVTSRSHEVEAGFVNRSTMP